MLRPFLDGFIFLTHQVALAFLLYLAGWMLVQAIRGRAAPGSSPVPFARWGAVSLGAPALLLVAGFAAIGVWYLRLGGFAGEVEPSIASVSWALQSGQPLYHDLQAGERYSLLYGPSVYLTNGLFLKILGPTLWSAKVASFLAGVASLLLLHRALTTRVRSLPALVAVATAVCLFWAQGFSIYLVRPDALLVFTTAFGLLLVRRSGRVLGAAGLAALLGFAVNLKLHGAVYFAPILVLAARRWGLRTCLLACAGAVAVAAAPFALHPQISWTNYWAWVMNAAGHGLCTQDLALNLRFAFLLALPLVATAALRRDPWAAVRGDRLLAWAMGGAAAITAVVASKPGAGPVHMLPLVPVFVFVPALAWLEGRGERPLPRGRAARILVPALVPATVLTLLMSASVSEYRSTRLVAWQQAQAAGLAGEVRQIMATYPDLDISMACGGEGTNFRSTWLSPLLVFANNPLLVDPVAVMDCALAGTALPQATYSAVADGRIDLWLVPRGQPPFAKCNWYAPHLPIFPAAFQQAFTSHYSLRGRTRHYDLWFWNGLPRMVGRASGLTEAADVRQGPHAGFAR